MMIQLKKQTKVQLLEAIAADNQRTQLVQDVLAFLLPGKKTRPKNAQAWLESVIPAEGDDPRAFLQDTPVKNCYRYASNGRVLLWSPVNDDDDTVETGDRYERIRIEFAEKASPVCAEDHHYRVINTSRIHTKPEHVLTLCVKIDGEYFAFRIDYIQLAESGLSMSFEFLDGPRGVCLYGKHDLGEFIIMPIEKAV